ncbi:hypothetical protein FHW69_001292 [Luteibacter sp. Sphag1AF]|uniref:hypothetical protein n=1 Tax=Luteibacter sp. Sphag1AF TaxID=2587031 RepID=UPI00160CE056|nr:hypothetical protein [Luteibacter sp. Sphag1AF]MBB3226702.1 hypothetical protein [Luteibacter sp. Sphag1AF]
MSPGQMEQFRSTLKADKILLGLLNAAAASGAVKHFAVQSADGQAIPTGHFNPTSGTVTLPASSFTPPTTRPSADLRAVLRIQSMVVALSSRQYEDETETKRLPCAEMIHNLQDTLNSSPHLAAEVKRAATTYAQDNTAPMILESFQILGPRAGAGVGGSYDSEHRALNLPSASLVVKGPHHPQGSYRPHDLTFVIGHEAQHGFNSAATARAVRTFDNDVHKVASTREEAHDYTQPVGRFIQSSRDDEAKAEIAGWNALHSRVQQSHPNMTLDDILNAAHDRAEDFLMRVGQDKSLPRSNIHLNPDLSMPFTPTNIAGMGENYFNRPSPLHKQPDDTRQVMTLGAKGIGDYPDFYGNWAVKIIAEAEQKSPTVHGKKPEVQINMEHLGLHEDVIEPLGLGLPSKRSLPYADTSRSPASRSHFDHTLDGPHQFSHVPESPINARPAPLMNSALHRELRDALPAETSPDRLAQIAWAVKKGGIEAGHIRTMDIEGERLMLTGLTPGTHAVIDLSTPPPPALESDNHFHALVERQMQRDLERQHELSQELRGPSMSLCR